ncbi:DEAD/DEAH box helicase [Kamptonema sp. UHCC 0994]|uniref:DEAD/DEAH box helicase n=1 Tax=Kamptonema sp. UHCC 0994 TaxID=3031329 RepID=UPI0023B8B2B3|nr:DEAD/DEAH box helicase [Kamptonema sp. UHCC 0994]MDF0553097.1 DEAD/DEAH box helicase [Kamptonema sp. UHCC 0994]
MAILHGTWLLERGGYLFIWGETWRRITANQTPDTNESLHNPYTMAEAELNSFLTSLHESKKLNWLLPEIIEKPQEKTKATSKQKKANLKTSQKSQSQKITTPKFSTRWENHAIALPTQILASTENLIPLHSATTPLETTEIESQYLYPWQVEGFYLHPLEAFTFLQALPLGADAESFVGSDLRFWSHVSRWSLDLLARGKFLPALESSNSSKIAIWQPLLDSEIDRIRLVKFAKQMPTACRTYQKAEGDRGDKQEEINQLPITNHQLPKSIDLPPTPEELLKGFLSRIIDTQVRIVGNQSLEIGAKSAVREWLKALNQESNTVESEPDDLEHLENAIAAWKSPLLALAEQNQFHTGFHLIPPSSGKRDWTLNYCLQAADDPEFIVDAATIWNHPVERLNYRGRTLEFPQENLLSGLGLASKLYPLIEPTLQQQSPQYCQLNPLQAYEFIKSFAWRFTDTGLGVILPPSLANREGWASRLGLSIQAETPTTSLKSGDNRIGLQSLLNFKWKLTIGGQQISKAEFDRLIALNSPLVEINGEWVELRAPDVKAAQTFFASRKESLTLSLEDALRLASGDTQTIEKLPVVSFEATGKLQELLNTLSNNESVNAINPKSFQGELRPYQARGVGWLSFLEKWGLGACLADDMGMGKTAELIAFLLHLQEQKLLESPTLLVCPTSVLGNWEREVKKFGPTLKVLQHYGNKRPKGKAFATAIKGKDLIITSYPLVYRDAKELQSIKWQGVVLDEAQNIKNSEAKQSQAVRQIEGSFKIAMTGTPVENRLQELWSILEFLNPGYLGQRNFFQRRFAIPIEKYGDKESLQTLRSLVQPFILRRLKTDKTIIQDLPEKQEMTVFCPLSIDQANIYQKVVEESLAAIESADGIQRRGMILGLLVKLKQICNYPILSKQEGKGKKIEIKSQESGKLQRLDEMLEEVMLAGDRALIFTQFAEWGHLLKAHLEKQFSREILFLYGGTRQQQREEMIDRFQHDPQGPPIMILSLKAGGTGLNLTRATHVFHYDRWWNPAVENQATDRVFRIGQTRNVQVHKFVCTGTLEEKIHDMIESKKALAEQVVGGGENWLTELDTDQLRNLLILDRNAIIEEEGE